TELFFRQAVGRLVRWTRGVPRQRAWLYIPDDPRLRLLAARIAEQRRHSLRRADGEPVLDAEREEQLEGPAEQLSLFAVISAVATGAAGAGDDEHWDDSDDDVDDQVELALAPPPLLARDSLVHGETVLTRREEKLHLRDANATVARELVRRTGQTHAQVNAELNRLAGVRRVAQATLDELERRLAAGDRWLAKT
ncbi:MAG TPA: hypothetical protein VJ986_14380, partial [Gaiellaceae bacterium]|nr:hypothetical protein [Gaiellaceae bacterium]